MKVCDPGHGYTVDNYDSETNSDRVICFMKREGEGYPGNVGKLPGTNCQEVLRVLIDRVKYLQNQIPCWHNTEILKHLRYSLYLFENRAALRHDRKLILTDDQKDHIEDIPTCRKCGHIQCKGHV